MAPKNKVQLLYVYVGGQLRRVADFKDIPVGSRPPALCPACHQTVILRLGSVRAAHAAHHPHTVCPTSNPETAAHLNAKLHICHELRQIRTLDVSYQCPGIGEIFASTQTFCDERIEMPWLHDWDDVLPEVTLEGVRPDVALLQNQRIIGAVEVRMTHAVDDEKAEVYRRLALPWIEVRATDVLRGMEPKWTVGKPLPVVDHGPERRWRCDSCATGWEVHLCEDHCFRVVWSRVVDFYYPSGKPFRALYQIRQGFDRGRPACYWLCPVHEGGMSPVVWEPQPPEDEVVLHLREVFRSAMRTVRDYRQAFIDSPMEWSPGEITLDRARDFKVFPRRYKWTRADKSWHAIENSDSITWDEAARG